MISHNTSLAWALQTGREGGGSVTTGHPIGLIYGDANKGRKPLSSVYIRGLRVTVNGNIQALTWGTSWGTSRAPRRWIIMRNLLEKQLSPPPPNWNWSNHAGLFKVGVFFEIESFCAFLKSNLSLNVSWLVVLWPVHSEAFMSVYCACGGIGKHHTKKDVSLLVECQLWKSTFRCCFNGKINPNDPFCKIYYFSFVWIWSYSSTNWSFKTLRRALKVFHTHAFII